MEIEKKVLIAVDLNFETGFILSKAASFFRETSAKFYIFHIIYSDIFTFLGKPGTVKAKSEEAYKSVENELKNAGLYYLNYEIFISTGVPAAEIINFSKKKGVDIIALGTHQRIGFKEFVSGSVSFSVSKNSICPVLLIPLKDILKSEAKQLVEEPAASLININPS
ncbi:MAG: universal stress protein [Deltaproteobacteria bacterium]|nr:universal stress protein [Deltaproteobacteria bacterium]